MMLTGRDVDAKRAYELVLLIYVVGTVDACKSFELRKAVGKNSKYSNWAMPRVSRYRNMSAQSM